MNEHDLTAIALQKLSPEDRPHLSAEEAKEAAEISALAGRLREALREEPEAALTLQQRRLILSAATDPTRRRWPVTLALGGLAACLLAAPFLPWLHWFQSGKPVPVAQTAESPAPLQVMVPSRREAAPGFSPSAGLPFAAPLPLWVGDASVAAVRRALAAGRLPHPGEVDPAELVNYFTPPAAPPRTGLFALESELTPCAWDESKWMLRLVVTVREGSRVEPVARDVVSRLDFDPGQVKSWRLIGFANASTSTPRAVEVMAGQSICLIYEITPTLRTPGERNALAELSISYSDPARTTRTTFRRTISGDLQSISSGALLSSAAAVFGLTLTADPNRGESSFALAEQLARRSSPSAPRRDDFLALLTQARTL